jgi:transporter family-2 protein
MANPAQAGANAELRKSSGDAIFSALVVYASGLVFVALALLVTRHLWPGKETLAHVPWWAWLGGVLSIASTLAGITLAQRLGSGVFTGITITASLVISILFDHYGWLGFKEHPASWPRIAGACLMVSGLWLVSRF